MTGRTVGVLALQGDYALHGRLLLELGVGVRMVRRPNELAGCTALVMPGGESTTLRKLLVRSGLDAAIINFAGSFPVLGTCAGCILLATELEDGHGVVPLGLLDITVRRNGYGRQVDSFEGVVEGPIHRDRSLLSGPRALPDAVTESRSGAVMAMRLLPYGVVWSAHSHSTLKSPGR
jgi:pyridoxal 5'-phosphate synthase glutaminase subunit Pdx2